MLAYSHIHLGVDSLVLMQACRCQSRILMQTISRFISFTKKINILPDFSVMKFNVIYSNVVVDVTGHEI